MNQPHDFPRFLKKLEALAKSGALYEALASPGAPPFFRYVPKLPEEERENFDALSRWTAAWEAAPRAADGHPLYTLAYVNKICGSLGKQRLPAHVFVATAADALALLGRTERGEEFLRERADLAANEPALLSWHAKYFERIREENLYPGFLSLAGAFREGTAGGKFRREVAAAGMDTKFIERHGFLLRTMWNALFPERAAESVAALTERLAWREEAAPNLYVRFLDGRTFYGAREIFLSADALADFRPPVSRVFITENKVSGLTFPAAEDALLLAGAGYGILEAAARAAWLSEKEINYWGDLDTDGFYILGKLREICPRVRSFLMTKEIFETYARYAVRDEGNQTAVPPCLTLSEKSVWKSLSEKGLRLEQERIPRAEIEREIALLSRG